jgi:hypothetical protein
MNKFQRTILYVSLCIPLAGFAASPGTSLSDPTKFDIVGIRLGMTMDEVLAALHAYKQSLIVTNVKSKIASGKEIITLTAMEPDQYGQVLGYDTQEAIAVRFTIKPQLSYIVLRHAPFPIGKEPLRTNTENQLKEKYGEPSFFKNDYQIWSFDKNQKKLNVNKADADNLTSNPDLFYCLHHGGADQEISPTFKQAGRYGVPVNISDKCDISLSVMLSGSATTTSDVIGRIEERLLSDKLALDNFQYIQKAEQAFEQGKSKQENEQARMVKPAL